MRVKILGIQKVDYVSKKSGRQVTGTTLHGVVKDGRPQEGLTGERVESIFVSTSTPLPKLAVDDEVNIFYNRYGSVDEVQLVKM